MALRVLLADESNTIRRVIELSLQDYAVEVKSVNVGLDVLPIAKSFKPDIVLADILLQKVSGYEVCALLKKDPQLAAVPVVLMWSGFMDLDEQRYQSCGADSKLEKPFGSDSLRKIVNDLVVKTRSQNLSKFVTLPDFVDDSEKTQDQPILEIDDGSGITEVDLIPHQPPPKPQEKEKSWDMNSFESLESFAQKMQEPKTDAGDEEFAQVKLHKLSKNKPVPNQNLSPADFPSADSWIRQDLSQFQAPPVRDEEEDFLQSLDRSSSKIKNEPTRGTENTKGKLVLDDLAPVKKELEKLETQEVTAPPALNLSEEQIEKIIAKQAREIIETVVWRVVPDIAERLVREELQRLLQDKDKELRLE